MSFVVMPGRSCSDKIRRTFAIICPEIRSCSSSEELFNSMVYRGKLFFDDCTKTLKYLFNRLRTINFSQDARLLVIGDERAGLFIIHFQALPDRFRVVICSKNDGGGTKIAYPFTFR